MEKEQGIAIALAATAAALAEALTERDQYKSALDWKGKKCDALQEEGLRLRRDLSAANRELEMLRTAQTKPGEAPAAQAKPNDEAASGEA